MNGYNHGKADEMALALMYLTLHDENRAWKGLDWGILNRLHEKGLILEPRHKAKSVVLTAAGLKQAEKLFTSLLA